MLVLVDGLGLVNCGMVRLLRVVGPDRDGLILSGLGLSKRPVNLLVRTVFCRLVRRSRVGLNRVLCRLVPCRPVLDSRVPAKPVLVRPVPNRPVLAKLVFVKPVLVRPV